MYSKVRIERKEDLEIVSQFAGCPPCQILVLNNARFTEELLGREVIIKVSLSNLVRSIKPRYAIQDFS